MKIYTYDNKVMTIGDKWMEQPSQPGPGPGPTLPPYTIRLEFSEAATPSFSKGTAVQVSSSPNIWDLTYENTDWSRLCYYLTDLVEVIDANTAGVTNMYSMFEECSGLTTVSLFDTSSVTDMSSMFMWCGALTTVPLFDTSNVTNMYTMFRSCGSLTAVPLFDTSNVTNMDSMFKGSSSLTTVPLFDTSKVTDMDGMFQGCIAVQSGAYALYQQASTQTTPPTYHDNTFYNCGSNTTTGLAELALIPTDWGGNDGEFG